MFYRLHEKWLAKSGTKLYYLIASFHRLMQMSNNLEIFQSRRQKSNILFNENCEITQCII